MKTILTGLEPSIARCYLTTSDQVIKHYGVKWALIRLGNAVNYLSYKKNQVAGRVNDTVWRLSTFIHNSYSQVSSNVQVLVGRISHAVVPMATKEQKNRVSYGIAAFANELCSKISASQPIGQSYAISPISIIAVLGMCLNIIKEEKKSFFLKKIGFGELTEMEAHVAIAETLKNMALPESFKDGSIDIAQGLAAKKHIVFDEQLVAILSEIYSSELIVSDDLQTQVNLWVASKTHNEIKEILPDNNSDFVFLNAVYLNLKWAQTFEKSEWGWRLGQFSCTNGVAAEVSMMTQVENYRVYRGDIFDMLEKPYRTPTGRQLSQLIFLPHHPSLLDAMEANLMPEMIKKCRKDAQWEYGVHLTMPKIRAECSLSLLNILKGMGLPLDSIDHNQISDILHKTVISNDEEGTVAAAVTAIVNESCCLAEPIKIPVFCIDHSYAYLIMDKETMLFRGRISDATPLIVDKN